jgi:hypothetical protein
VSRLAERQARRLKPHDRPALVIWGAQDQFIKPEIAQRQREAFPHASIELFDESGHWPFVSEEDRTVRLMRAFFTRHVLERAGVRIRASVRRRGGRLLVRAWLRAKPRRYLAGATVRAAGRKAVTGVAGRARLPIGTRGALRMRVSKAPLKPIVVAVRPQNASVSR